MKLLSLLGKSTVLPYPEYLQLISDTCKEYNKCTDKDRFREIVKKRLSELIGGEWHDNELFLEVDLILKEEKDGNINDWWAGKKGSPLARSLYDLQELPLRNPVLTSKNLQRWIIRHISPRGSARGFFDDLTEDQGWAYLPAKENMMGTVRYEFSLQPTECLDSCVDENQGVEWEEYRKIKFNIPPIDAIASIEFESVSGNSRYRIQRVSETCFEVVIEKVSLKSILELAELAELNLYELLVFLIKQACGDLAPYADRGEED